MSDLPFRWIGLFVFLDFEFLPFFDIFLYNVFSFCLLNLNLMSFL